VSGYCQCQTPKPRPSGGGKIVCVNPNCHKEMKADGGNYANISARPSKAEIEIIERKTRSMIALGEEILNRLEELKAS
jgi:hypothetical protein